MRKEYMTKQGYQKLVEKREELKKKQSEAGLMAGEAAGQSSDWHDNPAYEQAQEQIRILARQITELEIILKNAIIIEDFDQTNWKEDEVAIGVSVTIDFDGEEETYFIGGSADSNPFEGIISYKSPVARALLGHKVGEEVDVITPAASYKVRILKVERVMK